MTKDRRRMLMILAASALGMAKGAAADGTPETSEGIAGADASAEGPAAATDETLKGQVLTYDGKPVMGASVSFQSLDTPPTPIPDIGRVTGDDGRFGAALPPGRWRVTVMSMAGTSKSHDTAIAAGQRRSITVWLAQ